MYYIVANDIFCGQLTLESEKCMFHFSIIGRPRSYSYISKYIPKWIAAESEYKPKKILTIFTFRQLVAIYLYNVHTWSYPKCVLYVCSNKAKYFKSCFLPDRHTTVALILHMLQKNLLILNFWEREKKKLWIKKIKQPYYFRFVICLWNF